MYSTRLGSGMGSPSARMPSKCSSIASRILRITSSSVPPVLTQPGPATVHESSNTLCVRMPVRRSAKRAEGKSQPLKHEAARSFDTARRCLAGSDIHGSVGLATLDESGMQYPKRTAPCERSRLFTCAPYRPGKSLRVDPSAALGMTKQAAKCHKSRLSWQGRDFQRDRFQCYSRPV